MTTTDSALPFPVTTGREKGYDIAAVNAFLAEARGAFETENSEGVVSGKIRTAAFPVVRRGYQIAAVDAAMGRIEDAFAGREREHALVDEGARAWVSSSRSLAQEILDRLSRPERKRFRRASALGFGYRIDEVDLVADRIADYLETGASLSVEQIRGTAFRMQRRGYDEAQVDAVLDATIEVMLAVG